MKTLYRPEAHNDFLWALVGSPWGVLAVWLVLLNLFTFLFFGLDKWKAKRPGARRIPEKNLFLAAALGGSLGALLGMRVWHHKTLHKSFRLGIPAILIAQIVLAVGLAVYWTSFR